jgi:hypothetical protein
MATLFQGKSQGKSGPATSGLGAGLDGSTTASAAGSGRGSGSASRGASGCNSASGRGATSMCNAARTDSEARGESFTSHSQQSLHLRHFSQTWLSHASLVHRAQIRVDSSPQMLH